MAPGGPAHAAGIAATKLRWDGTVDLGDLLVRIDGAAISNVDDLLEAIERRQDGDVVAIEVLRGCDPARREMLTPSLL